MAQWPSVEQLAQVLNVENVDDWETTLGNVRAAAIDYVKLKRGAWIEGTDAPDESLSLAALRMAEMMAVRPGATPDSFSADPTFTRLMFGRRRRFGVS